MSSLQAKRTVIQNGCMVQSVTVDAQHAGGERSGGCEHSQQRTWIWISYLANLVQNSLSSIF